jgi:deoxyribonuclease IV
VSAYEDVGATSYRSDMTSVPIGAHVEQQDPIAEARARSADLAQFFLGDPQSYKGPVIAYEKGAAGLAADADAAGIGLYVHAPYLINVATTNNRIRIPSRKLLQQFVDAATEVGARALIVHAGHVLRDDDPEIGFDNWRKAVDRLELRCPVLIENTAGGDNAMARRLDRIARLWDAIGSAKGGDTIGFCLDTCHFHAGGEELATVVDRVKAITGRVDLVHANDSQDEFDSSRDRHANFGAGQIAADDMLAVVRAAGAPVIVETPGGAEGQGADIAWLRDRLDPA